MNRDVKVGDKIMVTEVNGEVLSVPHLTEITAVDNPEFGDWIDIKHAINLETCLFNDDGEDGDKWYPLGEFVGKKLGNVKETPTHPQYDDEAISPSYSDAVKAGLTFAEYTGAHITEESLDFEPWEEEALRGITADSLNFEEAPKSDAVNHPSHYNRYSREVIESIKGLCTPEEFRGYLKGNIIKYSARYSGKDGLQDIDKLAKYTQFLKEFEIEMEDE